MTALIDTHDEYTDLLSIYLPIALGVFLVVLALVGFALWRYRAQPGRAPSGESERNRVEAAYALALTGVAAALLYFTFSTEARVDPVPKRPGLVVDVSAAKWTWRFSYPRLGITVLSTNRQPRSIVVPTGTEIVFRLRSIDVIHSFQIPELRTKKDVFPGRTNELGLAFPKTGLYGGQCAEFCGLHHAEMLFRVEAVVPEEFRAWASRERGGAPA